MLLGVEVVAGEGKRRVRLRGEERQVRDPSTPAATAASTAVVCSFTRSNAYPANTKNSARTPSSARRIASPSP